MSRAGLGVRLPYSGSDPLSPPSFKGGDALCTSRIDTSGVCISVLLAYYFTLAPPAEPVRRKPARVHQDGAFAQLIEGSQANLRKRLLLTTENFRIQTTNLYSVN